MATSVTFTGDYTVLEPAIKALETEKFVIVETPGLDPVAARKRLAMCFRRSKLLGYYISVIPNLGVAIRKPTTVDIRKKMSRM